jgi:hypothetical protein
VRVGSARAGHATTPRGQGTQHSAPVAHSTRTNAHGAGRQPQGPARSTMMSGAATMDQIAICVRSSSGVMQPLPISSMSAHTRHQNRRQAVRRAASWAPSGQPLACSGPCRKEGMRQQGRHMCEGAVGTYRGRASGPARPRAPALDIQTNTGTRHTHAHGAGWTAGWSQPAIASPHASAGASASHRFLRPPSPPPPRNQRRPTGGLAARGCNAVVPLPAPQSPQWSMMLSRDPQSHWMSSQLRLRGGGWVGGWVGGRVRG